jgi:hypothetical protein
MGRKLEKARSAEDHHSFRPMPGTSCTHMPMSTLLRRQNASLVPCTPEIVALLLCHMLCILNPLTSEGLQPSGPTTLDCPVNVSNT